MLLVRRNRHRSCLRAVGIIRLVACSRRCRKAGVNGVLLLLRSVYLIAGFISRFLTRNAQVSAASSIALEVGRPAPWPARVSMRAKTGAGPAWQYCNWAMNLKLWLGTTRSSVSAVVTRVAGYLVPGF